MPSPFDDSDDFGFGDVPGLTREANPGELQFIGDSTCVRSAKYESSYRTSSMGGGDLTIQFNDGSIYVYHGVSNLVWANFLRTLSKGYFFNKYIRNRYPFD